MMMQRIYNSRNLQSLLDSNSLLQIRSIYNSRNLQSLLDPERTATGIAHLQQQKFIVSFRRIRQRKWDCDLQQQKFIVSFRLTPCSSQKSDLQQQKFIVSFRPYHWQRYELFSNYQRFTVVFFALTRGGYNFDYQSLPR